MTEDAAAYLAKARALTKAANEAQDAGLWTSIPHLAYYAMFHAAIAALLASDASVSTNHGRLVQRFGRWAQERFAEDGRRAHRALSEAYSARVSIDYDPYRLEPDIAEEASAVMDDLAFVLDLCAGVVEPPE